MKRFTQVVLPILILVGLIGGVTFVAHYRGGPRRTAPPARTSDPGVAARPATPVEPSLRTYPDPVNLGEWYVNGPAPPTRFWCWSTTEADFTLTAADPLLDVAFRPLTPQECRELSQALPDGESTVGSAYEVTVQPRTGPMLDLGPLERDLLLHSDAVAEPLRVHMTGRVRGDVTVGSGTEPERIDLGLFAAEQGTRRSLALTTSRPGLRLASWTPEYLAVHLREETPAAGKQQWRLSVEVPPGRAAGPLPADSAVMVTIPGNPPQRLRIPVTGQAYR